MAHSFLGGQPSYLCEFRVMGSNLSSPDCARSQPISPPHPKAVESLQGGGACGYRSLWLRGVGQHPEDRQGREVWLSLGTAILGHHTLKFSLVRSALTWLFLEMPTHSLSLWTRAAPSTPSPWGLSLPPGLAERGLLAASWPQRAVRLLHPSTLALRGPSNPSRLPREQQHLGS